jgi:hypothetical protein
MCWRAKFCSLGQREPIRIYAPLVFLSVVIDHSSLLESCLKFANFAVLWDQLKHVTVG